MFTKLFGALFTAFVTALLGLWIGAVLYQVEDKRNFEGWIIPEGVVDTRHFKIVGIMHFFSYLGAFTGLAAGVFRQLKLRKRREIRPTGGKS